jgi:hypothetical protein
LILGVGGVDVVRLDVSRRSAARDVWSVSGVSALVAGAWIVDVVDLAGLLRAAEGESLRQWQLEHYGEMAASVRPRDDD